MRKTWLAVGLFVAVVPGSPAASAEPASPLAAASWLAGCWRMEKGERVTEEQWMAPAGDLMLGMSRTVKAGRLVEYEFVRIAAPAGRATYIASPSGQATAEFPLTESTADRLVFANPAHDFPQRIIYLRQGPDELLARVEGGDGETLRGVDFPYRRVRCP